MVFDNVQFDESVRTYINNNPFFVTTNANAKDLEETVQLDGKNPRGKKSAKIMEGGYAQIRNYTGSFSVLKFSLIVRVYKK